MTTTTDDHHVDRDTRAVSSGANSSHVPLDGAGSDPEA
jgi:hypothetical protein